MAAKPLRGLRLSQWALHFNVAVRILLPPLENFKKSASIGRKNEFLTAACAMIA